MIRHLFARFVCAATLCTALFGSTHLWADEITSGVNFYQIDYDFFGVSGDDDNSGTGEVTIDPSLINPSVLSSVGPSGYINIYSGGSWVVENMPVNLTSGAITTDFALPGFIDGTDVTSLTAYVDYAAAPVTSFSAAPTNAYGVGLDYYDAEGDEAGSPTGAPVTPGGTVSFNPLGNNQVVYQPNHPNVQAAFNQCAPAALANNLDWMRSTYGLTLDKDNGGGSTTIQNIQGQNGTPANSLVALVDTEMGRTVVSRSNGQGVGRLSNVQGTLNTLIDLGHPNMEVKFTGKNSNGSAVSATDVTVGPMTALRQGNDFDFTFVLNELNLGHAVQMSFSYPAGGGHAVEVVGAGYVLGVPWLWYKSDNVQFGQAPSGDTKGTTQLDWSFVGTGNVLINEAGKPVAQFAISEAVPEPSTLVLFALAGLLALPYHVRRRRRS